MKDEQSTMVRKDLNLILMLGGGVDDEAICSLNPFPRRSPHSVATVIIGGGSAHCGSIHILALTATEAVSIHDDGLLHCRKRILSFVQRSDDCQLSSSASALFEWMLLH